MKVARFRFDQSLRRLLQRDHSDGQFEYTFRGPQSAKHLIESVGIPHTEIGRITAQFGPVDQTYLVNDGDKIEVFANDPMPDTTIEPRFVLDGHLGRLAARLRMLSLDCLYRNDYDDVTLLRVALAEDRFLLTRDRRLLMHKSLARGYLIRNLEPLQQLPEVVRRYGLHRWVRPFQRCIRCNHLLEAVDKQAIIDRLEPLTKLHFNEFRICPACRQIYWKGSHYDEMVRSVEKLKDM